MTSSKYPNLQFSLNFVNWNSFIPLGPLQNPGIKLSLISNPPISSWIATRSITPIWNPRFTTFSNISVSWAAWKSNSTLELELPIFGMSSLDTLTGVERTRKCGSSRSPYSAARPSSPSVCPAGSTRRRRKWTSSHKGSEAERSSLACQGETPPWGWRSSATPTLIPPHFPNPFPIQFFSPFPYHRHHGARVVRAEGSS